MKTFEMAVVWCSYPWRSRRSPSGCGPCSGTRTRGWGRPAWAAAHSWPTCSGRTRGAPRTSSRNSCTRRALRNRTRPRPCNCPASVRNPIKFQSIQSQSNCAIMQLLCNYYAIMELWNYVRFGMQFDEKLFPFEREFAHFGPREMVHFGIVLEDADSHVGDGKIHRHSFRILPTSKINTSDWCHQWSIISSKYRNLATYFGWVHFHAVEFASTGRFEQVQIGFSWRLTTAQVANKQTNKQTKK